MPAGKRAFLQGVAFWGVVLGLCYLGLRYALPCFLPLVLGAVMAAALHPAAAGLCRRLGWRYRPCAVLVAVAALTLLGLMLWGSGEWWCGREAPCCRRSRPLPGDAAAAGGGTAGKVADAPAGAGRRRMGDLPGGGAAKCGDLSFPAGGGLAGGHCFLAAINFIHHDLYGAFHHLLLQDYAGITGFIVRSLPGRWLRPMVESKRYLLGAVQKVLFAYLCIMFITFGEITLGLWLLRVPYFAAIAFAIALLDILPSIGSGLFLIPWGAYHLLISRQTALGAGLLLLYAVVTVVRMWLEPRIVGGRIGLHPLATLTAMYAGLKILGSGGCCWPRWDDAAAASAAGRLPAGEG
ncbi:MAG: AI-2E family transporter [Angelakisella sp.]